MWYYTHMPFTFAEIIFFALLVDSLGGIWVAWFGRRWYLDRMGVLSRYFPPAKGWAVYYLLLVLLFGYLLGIFG